MRIKPGDHGYLPIGKHSQVSITERAGRWYVAVIGPEVAEAGPNGGSSLGIDMGVARLATLSDGTVIENPKALKHGERKIKRLQKGVSRKEKRSSNRHKARTRLARAYARTANLRRNVLHKSSTMLAKNHSLIVIEDLKVKNMTHAAKGKGRSAKAGLNRVVLDASLGEFRRMLEYKGKLYGCKVTVVPPAYTSQKCSACGYVSADNRKSQSQFLCLNCGLELNADLNAAINILVAGSCPDTVNACGEEVSPGRLRLPRQTPVKQESAWTRLSMFRATGQLRCA